MPTPKRIYELDTTAETSLGSLYFAIDSSGFDSTEKITVDSLLSNTITDDWNKVVTVDPLFYTDGNKYPLRYGPSNVELPIYIGSSPLGPANAAIQLGASLGNQTVLILPGFGAGQQLGFFGQTPVVRQTFDVVTTVPPTFNSDAQAMLQAIWDALQAYGLIDQS